MKFEIYRDASGLFRWRLKSSNGRIVADSAQGYRRKNDCRKMIAAIVEEFAHFQIPVIEL